MKTSTQTTQYHIELLSASHYEAFYELIQNNIHRLEDFFAGIVSKTTTLKTTQEYCTSVEINIKNKSYFPYVIIETQTDKLVGLLDVKNIEWSVPKAELGAFIDANHEGKGIVRYLGNELIQQIVTKHKFKKLYCRAAARNIRSIRVVKQLGFELEGTIRCDYRTTKGELVDLNYYGKVFDN
ncbi:GNAT family N-acetyltransferase [Tenacibaculum amylolyticum]|uniref:GNAT family N-acetyltransferase n=1 Tax=Tenacibaculum amylolyticum TaxID=104269 RepID=UPI0038938A68